MGEPKKTIKVTYVKPDGNKRQYSFDIAKGISDSMIDWIIIHQIFNHYVKYLDWKELANEKN